MFAFHNTGLNSLAIAVPARESSGWNECWVASVCVDRAKSFSNIRAVLAIS